MIIRDGTVKTVKAPAENRPEYGLIGIEYLSDAGGLRQFGLYRQVLEPGARTSTRHWHEVEDEFLYVLSGTPTVIENDGPHELSPGDICCWPGGVPNAHTVENRSDRPATILILGSRPGDDRCHYPDIGRTQIDEGACWRIVDDATGVTIKEGRRE
ncbi:cupin domain-containing protein [Solirhodobacter olei]|uniref:cupin domain-containing protein n=1 Tax=Solirhodobacter olei TaxID=2493082 RepID=UPI000FDA4240|nr:cupin domain-containing protein [Solirhodobacter olei]